jgi:hypothetical protein
MIEFGCTVVVAYHLKRSFHRNCARCHCRVQSEQTPNYVTSLDSSFMSDNIWQLSPAWLGRCVIPRMTAPLACIVTLSTDRYN